MSSHPSVKKEYLQSVRSVVSGAAPLGALDEEKLLKKAEKHINMLQGISNTVLLDRMLLSSFLI